MSQIAVASNLNMGLHHHTHQNHHLSRTHLLVAPPSHLEATLTVSFNTSSSLPAATTSQCDTENIDPKEERISSTSCSPTTTNNNYRIVNSSSVSPRSNTNNFHHAHFLQEPLTINATTSTTESSSIIVINSCEPHLPLSPSMTPPLVVLTPPSPSLSPFSPYSSPFCEIEQEEKEEEAGIKMGKKEFDNFIVRQFDSSSSSFSEMPEKTELNESQDRVKVKIEVNDIDSEDFNHDQTLLSSQFTRSSSRRNGSVLQRSNRFSPYSKVSQRTYHQSVLRPIDNHKLEEFDSIITTTIINRNTINDDHHDGVLSPSSPPPPPKTEIGSKIDDLDQYNFNSISNIHHNHHMTMRLKDHYYNQDNSSMLHIDTELANIQCQEARANKMAIAVQLLSVIVQNDFDHFRTLLDQLKPDLNVFVHGQAPLHLCLILGKYMFVFHSESDHFQILRIFDMIFKKNKKNIH